MRRADARTVLSRVVPLVATLLLVAVAAAQDRPGLPSTADRPTHQESAAQAADTTAAAVEAPALPPDMTLDEVLDRAASPPPEHYPHPVPDTRTHVFTLIEQLAWRSPTGGARDHLGWEAQGWIGGDFDRFWWKSEGEAVFEGSDEGEVETDLLYSRLITPFWDAQVGVQYAGGWSDTGYEDRWSGAIALQGLVPYRFELDSSLYVSEDGDVTLELEAEYDLRITQRLVLQPLFGLGLAAQDVPARSLGAGVTDGMIDARLRYELRREFAPYLGLRHTFALGETANIAEAAGEDPSRTMWLAGLRLAF